VKTIGIIGGIGPESTIEYYRALIAAYRARVRDGTYPPIVIDSIDMKKMLDLVAACALVELAEHLLSHVRRLAAAGAELGLIAANTPHLVFDDVRRSAPIPLLSIVEAACDATRALGLTKVGLLGTRFTMQAGFYQEVFARSGIELAVPGPGDQAYVHDKYMEELVHGVFLPETRANLLAVVDRLKETDRIQGLILGGTELPLILRDPEGRGIPFLDTTRIHVDGVVAQALS
jgi:aspartate racemase